MPIKVAKVAFKLGFRLSILILILPLVWSLVGCSNWQDLSLDSPFANSPISIQPKPANVTINDDLYEDNDNISSAKTLDLFAYHLICMDDDYYKIVTVSGNLYRIYIYIEGVKNLYFTETDDSGTALSSKMSDSLIDFLFTGNGNYKYFRISGGTELNPVNYTVLARCWSCSQDGYSGPSMTVSVGQVIKDHTIEYDHHYNIFVVSGQTVTLLCFGAPNTDLWVEETDSSYTPIGSQDGSTSDGVISISFAATAGKTYYLRICKGPPENVGGPVGIVVIDANNQYTNPDDSDTDDAPDDSSNDDNSNDSDNPFGTLGGFPCELLGSISLIGIIFLRKKYESGN